MKTPKKRLTTKHLFFIEPKPKLFFKITSRTIYRMDTEHINNKGLFGDASRHAGWVQHCMIECKQYNFAKCGRDCPMHEHIKKLDFTNLTNTHADFC